MLGKTGNARPRDRHGHGAGARQSAAETPRSSIQFVNQNRKGKTTMKEAMESLAAVAMIVAVMGLAYAAGCIQ